MDTDVNIDEGRTRALGKTLAPGGAAAVATAAVVGALAASLTGCAAGPPPSQDWMMGPRPAALNFSRNPAKPPVSRLVM